MAEFGNKFVSAVMYWQDAGHHKKTTQLKNGITSALDKVNASCFDKNGGPRFPDLTGGEQTQNLLKQAQDITDGIMTIPDVGTKGMDFTSMKIAGALAALGGALTKAGRTIWKLVFAH